MEGKENKRKQANENGRKMMKNKGKEDKRKPINEEERKMKNKGRGA